MEKEQTDASEKKKAEDRIIQYEKSFFLRLTIVL